MPAASKLEQAAVRDALVDGIRQGFSTGDAAALAGVHRSSLHRWTALAEQPEPERLVAESEAAHAGRVERWRTAQGLADAIAEAQAEARAEAVRTIRSAMLTDWRAAAWYLERTAPAEWGRGQRLEVSGRDGGPVMIEHPRPPFDRAAVEELIADPRRLMDVQERVLNPDGPSLADTPGGRALLELS